MAGRLPGAGLRRSPAVYWSSAQQLPEEAFDPLFGPWRWTAAGWVLAVEALALAGPEALRP